VDWRRLFRRTDAGDRLTPDLRRRIRSSFDEASADEEHFPSTIDPRIWHVKLVLEWVGDLEGKSVLDVGCGKGRFARIVAERNPGARVCGLDISPAMLRYVPAPVLPCAASMTELPFADGAFHAAYATESLEHAVEIERAVAEICRVVKPGGRIAIIDKNAEQFGRLETPDWEKWFTRGQLEKLLARHCRRVESRLVSYWEDVPPDGLFIAWTAER
jgi:ubiquinone/menaquinone biosynthesis C-methylase UbiE